ncbi:MAG TPA: SDR family oxidoreductase [Solirubrobacteraceae bacterium]|nr:SDR family oxidoreductase [Solirubrobacteraceae bacterium]
MSLPAPDPNSTVLITGASAGIGAELARQLAARGHSVAVVARRGQLLDELGEELRLAHGVSVDRHVCDLSDAAARQGLIAAVRAGERAVVGVCNNAGFGSFGSFWELPLEREVEEVALNVGALHELTGAFLPEMVSRGAGAILNVGSTAAFQPLPNNATYAATKAFVVSFSEAVHAELAGTGVSCTALCPGPVRTEFAASSGAGELEGAGPDFIWMSAADCARAGVEGMIAGKRSVVPQWTNKISATAGRLVPRSLLLPGLRRFGSRLGL